MVPTALFRAFVYGLWFCSLLLGAINPHHSSFGQFSAGVLPTSLQLLPSLLDFAVMAAAALIVDAARNPV